MPQHENVDRARAERIFKAREQQRAEAPKATADYYAALQKIRDRTQELRPIAARARNANEGTTRLDAVDAQLLLPPCEAEIANALPVKRGGPAHIRLATSIT